MNLFARMRIFIYIYIYKEILVQRLTSYEIEYLTSVTTPLLILLGKVMNTSFLCHSSIGK